MWSRIFLKSHYGWENDIWLKEFLIKNNIISKLKELDPINISIYFFNGMGSPINVETQRRILYLM